MRLTLRTLLAWLDDTLSPSEVREIGSQVSESPFAKELVEKIHRVTRQRRLTVPPLTGPDSVDANVVASYLDNQLEPELVAELEKKCLVSDVHLAEVASVHQVLSLIGQKAKVPVEARHRMYKLIKGREAVEVLGARASRQTEPRAATEPVQPWTPTPPPSRRWVEHYGPPLAVLGLILVMCAAAWKTLSTTDASSQGGGPAVVWDLKNRGPVRPDRGAAGDLAVKPGGRDDARADPTRTADAAKPSAATNSGKDEDKEKAREKDKDKDKEKDKAGDKEAVAEKDAAPGKAKETPPGSVGVTRKPAGVLLRYNPARDRREWERLTGVTPLREQDRLLSLAPFRASVEIGAAEVVLVGETEIWARATLPTHAARLILAQGRVVLHGTQPTLPFEVQFEGKTVKITPPPGGTVAVERVNRRAPGAPEASPPVLRVFAADGPVRLETGAHETTLDGSGSVTVEPDGAFSGENAKAPPGWVTETGPAPYDQERGEQFLKFLPADRPVVTSLVEASEDEQKDVCRLAISALRAVGDISYVVPLLSARGTATASVRRKAAIKVLREYLDQGPEAAKELQAQLRSDLGDDLAVTTQKLLVGYTPKEAGDEATFTRLVQILGNTDPAEVGLRELALDNLMALTGRDDLDYDPGKPEGKGLRAWRDLLHAHELKAVPAPKR